MTGVGRPLRAKEPPLDSHISPSSCVCTGFKLDLSHSSAGQPHASNEARAPIHYRVLSSIPARQTRSILHSTTVWPTPAVLYCRPRSTGCRRSNSMSSNSPLELLADGFRASAMAYLLAICFHIEVLHPHRLFHDVPAPNGSRLPTLLPSPPR